MPKSADNDSAALGQMYALSLLKHIATIRIEEMIDMVITDTGCDMSAYLSMWNKMCDIQKKYITPSFGVSFDEFFNSLSPALNNSNNYLEMITRLIWFTCISNYKNRTEAIALTLHNILLSIRFSAADAYDCTPQYELLLKWRFHMRDLFSTERLKETPIFLENIYLLRLLELSRDDAYPKLIQRHQELAGQDPVSFISLCYQSSLIEQVLAKDFIFFQTSSKKSLAGTWCLFLRENSSILSTISSVVYETTQGRIIPPRDNSLVPQVKLFLTMTNGWADVASFLVQQWCSPASTEAIQHLLTSTFGPISEWSSDLILCIMVILFQHIQHSFTFYILVDPSRADQTFYSILCHLVNKTILVNKTSSAIAAILAEGVHLIIKSTISQGSNLLNVPTIIRANALALALTTSSSSPQPPLLNWTTPFWSIVDRVLGCLHDQDVFKHCYIKYATRRFLSPSDATLQLEESIISSWSDNVLSSEEGCCSLGARHTMHRHCPDLIKRLQQLYKDALISRDINTTFQEQFACPLFVSVFQQSGASLSTQDTLSIPNLSSLYPEEYATWFSSFHAVYTSRFDSTRKLTWRPDLFTGDMIFHHMVSGHMRKYTFACTGYQMAIMFVLNTHDQISADDITSMTGLPHLEVTRLLESFVITKLLVPIPPPDGTSSTIPIFAFNRNYANKHTTATIKLSSAIPKAKSSSSSSNSNAADSHDDPLLSQSISSERRMVLQSSIVRLLKATKVMSLNDITEHLLSTLKVFIPSPALIKLSIEDLIDKEFIRRTDNNSVFEYLA
jgi:hypothetical protein